MKRTGAVAAMFLGASLVFGVVIAEGEGTATHHPPKDLKLVGDHWTAWDPPEPGPNDYIIQKGDTLWDLAGKWLGDPFLWPHVWDENRYILDSHWIYPGDPLVVPGAPEVVPEGVIPIKVEEITEDDTGEGEGEETGETEVVQRATPTLIPIADPGELYCSGWISTPEYEAADLLIANREMEQLFQGQGNVVYFNQGRNQGIEPGSEWAVIRPTQHVLHPETGVDLGQMVRRMGKARVLAVQENTSTAVIEMACEDIWLTDQLIPWQEMPIPEITEIAPFDRYDAEPSGGAQGYVVAFRDGNHSLPEWIRIKHMGVNNVGDGHVIYTDLGQATGLRPGDFLTLFRPNGDMPRLALGQAVVLTVEDSTSTVKVTRAVREIVLGDRVEVVQ